MAEVLDYIQRVVTKGRFHRERFADDKVPSKFDSIFLLPFFGDIKSEFILSTMLAHRTFNNKYVIVVSWPGHSGIYPDELNEYWTVNDDGALSDLVRTASGFTNSKATLYERALLRYFDNVMSPDDFIGSYYNNGLTASYLKTFQDVECVLPTIPSARIASHEHFKSRGVFIRPSKYIQRWVNGRSKLMLVDEKFWKILVKSLLDKGFWPVMENNYHTYDLSSEFGLDCFYLGDRNLLAALAVMRMCDCVLDVFNGISRYALIARSPYMSCDERQRYFGTNDYELDDLCGTKVPHKSMFSFAPVVNGNTANKLSQAIVNNLTDFVDSVSRDTLPSSVSTTNRCSYDQVRKRECTKIGTRLISVPVLEETN